MGWPAVEAACEGVENTEESPNAHNICLNTKYGNLSFQGGVWGAWRNFHDGRFFISAINPVKNYVKIYYRDENIHSRFRLNGVAFQNLSEAYVTWFDEGYEKGIDDPYEIVNNRYYSPYVLNIKNDISKAGVHVVFSGNDDEKSGWFPNNTEEVVAPSESLLGNSSQKLYIVYYIQNTRWPMEVDYSECMNSSEYEAGMECRLEISENMDQEFYYPFWPNDDGVDDENATESSEKSTNEDVKSDDEATEEKNEQGDTTEKLDEENDKNTEKNSGFYGETEGTEEDIVKKSEDDNKDPEEEARENSGGNNEAISEQGTRVVDTENQTNDDNETANSTEGSISGNSETVNSAESSTSDNSETVNVAENSASNDNETENTIENTVIDNKKADTENSSATVSQNAGSINNSSTGGVRYYLIDNPNAVVEFAEVARSSESLEAENTEADEEKAKIEDSDYVEVPMLGGECAGNDFSWWWIVILLVAGDAIVIWWFESSRAKKAKKLAKN